jgi:hypothetical protein
VLLTRTQWEGRRRAHEQRVDALLREHLRRRKSGRKHPVEDFLFTYYSYRPSHLRRWHPGIGVELEGVPPVDPVEIQRRAGTIRWIRGLLQATARRPAQLGCFGMHEWAMVYRQTPDELRHNAWPLRLGAGGTAQVLEERGVRCTHFDAFRFFTAPARPLNVHQPARDTQVELDQPGCLHANMDLYKWAYKLAPLTPSELIADCFELASAIRETDMRASPYDLAALGLEPIRVETPQGRAEYAARQREFAERSQPLRHKLISICDTAVTMLPGI